MNMVWTTEFTEDLYGPLYDLYKDEWWTKGRSKEAVILAFQQSDLTIFGLSANHELLACARLLSDFTFKAIIFDVIIADHARGQGLGRQMLDRFMSHERLEQVRDFELYCPDHIAPFYEGLGFDQSTSKLMRKRFEDAR